MVNIWTSQCKYNAPVYVSAPAIILKLVTDSLTDFEVELQNSFQFFDIQSAVRLAYTYMSLRLHNEMLIYLDRKLKTFALVLALLGGCP